MTARDPSTLFALGAIALWALLATLGVALSHLPPFLLTGLALVIGGVPAWPRMRDWRVPASTLALGVYGLFGFHFLLFVALRHAPPVEANLVNYLWPLFIVVLAPMILPGLTLRAPHVLAALAGFAGAALAISGGRADRRCGVRRHARGRSIAAGGKPAPHVPLMSRSPPSANVDFLYTCTAGQEPRGDRRLAPDVCLTTRGGSGPALVGHFYSPI